MTNPTSAPDALQRWIKESVAACAQAQDSLDRALARSILKADDKALSIRQSTSGTGLDFPLKRQVIQRMEMQLKGRWTKSATVGFRIEAGGRWREDFLGMAYEQKTTRSSTTTTSVTIHVETVPCAPPRQTVV
jgi:hypothetical protein